MATMAYLVRRLEQHGWTLLSERRPDSYPARIAAWPHRAGSAARSLVAAGGGDPRVVTTLEALAALRPARARETRASLD